MITRESTPGGGHSRSQPSSTSGPGGVAQALTRHDGVLWRRAAYAGAVHFPRWWRRRTPAIFGACAWALVRREARAVADNWLALGLVDTRAAAELGALRTFLEFAESLTDGLEIAGRGLDDFVLDTSGSEPERAADRGRGDALVEALALGRGAVLVTAHTGSWEVNGRIIDRQHHVGVTMVMAKEANPTSRGFADRLRAMGSADVEVAYVGEDPLDALSLVAALRRKRVVALQLDRTPPGMATISVPFFGRMHPFPLGPFRLAQLTGAPVVAAFTHRTGLRRYAIEMPAGLVTIPRARREGDATLVAPVSAIARGFESFVRRHPEQWFHFEPIEPRSGAR